MMPIVTAFLPLRRVARRSSAGPISIRDTSPSVTANPSASLTTIARELLSGVDRPVRDRTVNSRSTLSIRPAGSSRFWRRMRVLDVLDGQAVGGEPVAVEPDPHGVAALAQDLDLGDARQVLQPVARVAVDEVGDVEW